MGDRRLYKCTYPTIYTNQLHTPLYKPTPHTTWAHSTPINAIPHLTQPAPTGVESTTTSCFRLPSSSDLNLHARNSDPTDDTQHHTPPPTEMDIQPLPRPATQPGDRTPIPDPYEPAPVPDGFVTRSGRTVHHPTKCMSLIYNTDTHPHYPDTPARYY
ncbi:hypothetical protein Pcinc_009347 [Petrolisthes cinctipes]|uniref:Uncharacterized protein n=1 Tax=Petrolisthes cinctipes TaxID=88211 RepID=A0AAE1KUW0_PETCI|nr:hypothetical protein Pcinc_009347 [Petrolisthes cinctipes]